MKKIELIVTGDTKKTGHLFCHDCATELNVVLSHNQVYRNPQYAPDWELLWHDFHNVKFVFPKLLKDVWDKDIMKHVVCPYCSYIGKVFPNDGGLFDIKLIRKSLDRVKDVKYRCINCTRTFGSQKCVTSTGKEGEYICGDCGMFA